MYPFPPSFPAFSTCRKLRRVVSVVNAQLTVPLALCLAITVSLAYPSPALAAPGDLDPTFGNNGIVTTNSAADDSDLDNVAYAVLQQADGKLVIAGLVNGDGIGGSDFALVRYTLNGSLDSSFGNNGVAIASIGAFGSSTAFALIQQPDGKLIAAGSAYISNDTGSDFALVRYLPNGTLDVSFGSDGIVTTAVGMGDSYDEASALVLQPDGKIIAAGIAKVHDTSGYDFTLVRYKPDGSLDTSFGRGGPEGDGIVVTPVASADYYDAVKALVLQPDGKLVAAGYADQFPWAGSGDFALVRYHADGSLDTTFDADGIVTTAVGAGESNDVANALVLQPDGRLVAAGLAIGGDTNTGSQDFALVRYNAAGSLDASFGPGGADGDGIVTTDVLSNGSYDGIKALVLQPDGKLVAAGFASTYDNLGWPTGTGSDFALVRYKADGSLDESFNSAGYVTTAIGPDAKYDEAQALLLQSDGKLVAAGRAEQSNSRHDFALVRYLARAPMQVKAQVYLPTLLR